MQRHFDQELKDLNKDILKMSALAEEAIYKSIEALKNRDAESAKKIIDNDAVVDTLELAVDEKCIDLIARYQPMARDLRFITTGMKINAELERIADLAVNISQRVLEIVDKPILKPLIDIPKLTEIARKMVKDVIDAFLNSDEKLARKVIFSDSEADKLRNLIQKELVNDYMSKDAETVTRGVPLLLIARQLERICDHATNIAEDVIYMVQAKVVKHHPEMLDNQD
ncbi:MAG: phosphate transport system regulatory protein PhoU [Omnitrophica WOR_2 bacterium GWF2_38_59]|nr:MAG: phosphate transport system regulatory protein PhoU [Omnitrophica WOR_2 bacterium GWA2_37_7]OGX25750.1 MAG: phosphate transport system regulatory protein PhoU [Omnitrophica WOR_2 bacterium GWF2_38_59]OGX48335.1 MAG: phosphate transport system regulatory protein PhoU [Omnitrophica WOR_2 bacterium RIFOXYA2_FULL_38_17]OGX53149.1 MAG: phosphate transport system regulatory protein PhoU [Omnitrophica WOR_2 bacterium RIFOXYA12_FULL_38_10]OGX55114.1 MAG: phosphate transport system regulatory pro